MPESRTPVYFDALQQTARVALQRNVGAGVSAGVSLTTTVGTEGGDCAGIGPNARTPAKSTWQIGGAIDFPVLVGPGTALLLGQEGHIIPDAPGGGVGVNTLVMTLRHSLFRRVAF